MIIRICHRYRTSCRYESGRVRVKGTPAQETTSQGARAGAAQTTANTARTELTAHEGTPHGGGGGVDQTARPAKSLPPRTRLRGRLPLRKARDAPVNELSKKGG